MNLLVTLDSNYVYPLCVMLHSLVQTHPRVSFDVYVAYAHLTDSDFKTIGDALEGSGSRVIGIRVPDTLFDGAPHSKRLTKAAYYRLFASEYLPKTVDRVLYIDPDTYFLKDISDFYNIDFGDAFYAGCTHNNLFYHVLNVLRLHLPSNSVYLNSGVLMINVQALRSFFSPNEVFRYIEKKGAFLFFADQDVLNALYYDRILALDAGYYNLDEPCFKRMVKRVGESAAHDFVRANTCILHYDGKYKPWKADYKGNLGTYYPVWARKGERSWVKAGL